MAEVADRFDLERIVSAQDAGGAFEGALRELRRGHKATHWMWFVFPQLAGLGTSATARRFALASLEEASTYFGYPTLGGRLGACASVLLELDGRCASDMLGSIDASKLRSSMTLFARAAPKEPAFDAVLDRFFEGVADPLTLALL